MSSRRLTGMAVVALCLIACGPRPAPNPSPSPTGLHCSLPVLAVTQTASSPPLPGFVSIPAGLFTPAVGVSTRQLPPSAQPPFPVSYDWTVRRWLPVDQQLVSPDGRSYAYSVTKSGSYDLRVHSLSDGGDRWLWNGGSWPAAWPPSGILLFNGLVIDPRTGTSSRYSGPAAWLSASTAPPGAAGIFGFDHLGHHVATTGTRDPGSKYTVFVDLGGGKREVIHSGTHGDAEDFDPFGATADGDGIWMGNYDGRYLWNWSPASGLMRFDTAELAASDEVASPKGPCR